jgi:hypothetical protein
METDNVDTIEIVDMETRAEWLVEESILDSDHEQAFVIFCDWLGYEYDDESTDWASVVSDFVDSFCGEYSSHEDFVMEYMCDMIDDIPDWVIGHIDWSSVWNCELRYDFYEENGHYFRNI